MTPARKAMNYALAVVRHVADGMAAAAEADYEARLDVCRTCELRTEGWECRHPNCGCRLERKAAWRSESCPIGKWPGDDAREPARPVTLDSGPGPGPGCGGCGRRGGTTPGG